MKDPEADSFKSDSDSSEMDDNFDFVTEGEKRVGILFKAKKGAKDDPSKSIKELMKKNDWKLMNKLL
jgi:hypothetical protein